MSQYTPEQMKADIDCLSAQDDSLAAQMAAQARLLAQAATLRQSADSGRVGDDVVERSYDAFLRLIGTEAGYALSKLSRHTTHAAMRAALAAQGQGEAVAWQYRRMDDEEGPSPHWHDMTRQQYEMFRDSPRSNCEIRQLYTHPAPAASPAGVPDGWRDDVSLAAQMLTWGADEGLTASQEREVHAHQAKLFAMLAAAPSAPEGDGGEG